jgi:hypothetical protein
MVRGPRPARRSRRRRRIASAQMATGGAGEGQGLPRGQGGRTMALRGSPAGDRVDSPEVVAGRRGAHGCTVGGRQGDIRPAHSPFNGVSWSVGFADRTGGAAAPEPAFPDIPPSVADFERLVIPVVLQHPCSPDSFDQETVARLWRTISPSQSERRGALDELGFWPIPLEVTQSAAHVGRFAQVLPAARAAGHQNLQLHVSACRQAEPVR